jgi:hypothetical protein
MRFRSMRIPVSIRASYNKADIKALVDSGATDNFIHPNFVKRMGLGQQELDKPKNIYNINDTTNKSGQITHYLSLAVTTAGRTQEMRFLITDIGREDVLLRYPWCQDPSGDLLHNVCNSRGTKVQWVRWFNGALRRKQVTKVQWYSGSVGCRGVSK